ncbi:DUF1801 domain-containing protein [Blautia sp. RD014234]|nr:DUF1801 domain-containing protein [Blautia parvula]
MVLGGGSGWNRAYHFQYRNWIQHIQIGLGEWILFRWFFVGSKWPAYSGKNGIIEPQYGKLKNLNLRRKRNMWICPKCGREFKRINQGHYCGKAPKTVLEYIDSQPIETHPHLTELMIILQNSVPCVNERILWSMPYYEKEGKSISFSACKKHISFYVGVEAIGKFALELNEFVTKKNAIYFPYDKALPTKLIENIVKWCLS